METGERPSRIDQIFTDRRLIDEALRAAAADAVQRHRRAGVTMAVVRNGCLEDVPPERLAPDVDALLTEAELQEERTAKDLITWLEERRSAIDWCRVAGDLSARQRQRFSAFCEELFPLALWMAHWYPGREDVACSSNAGTGMGASAVVTDYATDPPAVTSIQLATAVLHDHSSIPLTSSHLDGFAETEFDHLTHEERLARTFGLIEAAVRRCSRHGSGSVMVVAFDDFLWFGTEDDRAALTAFVTSRLPSWRLDAARLDIVGLSGRTFLSFPTSAG